MHASGSSVQKVEDYTCISDSCTCLDAAIVPCSASVAMRGFYGLFICAVYRPIMPNKSGFWGGFALKVVFLLFKVEWGYTVGLQAIEAVCRRSCPAFRRARQKRAREARPGGRF